MAWLAATFHDDVCAGTELAIFQEPWDPEAALLQQLPASVDLGIDFPDGAAEVVWVRDVMGSEAAIQTSDQIKWRMILVDVKELKYPPPPTEDPHAPIGLLRNGLHNEPQRRHAAANSAGSIKVASSASAFGLLSRLRDVSEDYETKSGSKRRQGIVQRP